MSTDLQNTPLTATATTASSAANDDRLYRLAHEPVGRLLLHYSIPAIVGMVVMQLYNIVDRVFIGRVVGSDAMAGLAITFPVQNIATALGVLIGVGASSRISIMLGNNDFASARRITGNALTMTIVIGLSYIACFAIFIDPILELFGATERSLPYARDMMLWILPGLMLTNVAFSFNNVMRASGFPTKAMVTMFIGAGVNILLDPIFIYVFDWGIRGAAIATDIAMAVSAVFVMQHFVKPHGQVYFERGTYRVDRRILMGIISIGASPFLINVASCLINILINRSLNEYGGTEAIAAAGVFVTATAFACSVVLGLTQGMQPIVGYNYGAGAYGRMKRTFIITSVISTGITTVAWMAGMLVPEAIASAFLTEPELVKLTGHYLVIAMSMFWMVGFPIVSTTYFQAIGSAGKAIFLSMIRQVLLIIPLLLILPRYMGIEGIWTSFPVSDVLATLVTLAMVVWQMRRLGKKS